MRAILTKEAGGPEVLDWGETPEPTLGPEDIRIRVVATAVNRADLMQRMGFYPPPPGASPILGLECSGEVVEVGDAVPGGRAPGDRVMALLAGGGYAEQVVVHHGSVMDVPESLDLVAAAGTPEVFLTVFLNVFRLAAFPAGGSLLVHGGASGIGTAAIALVREAGGRCLVTAGSPEKCERCLELGADAAIDYRREDFAERVSALTSGRGVDVVLDSIGGPYLAGNLASLAVEGRLVLIGLMGGGSAELDLGSLLLRRLQIIGSTLRGRSVAEKADLVAAFVERFGPALDAGRIAPVVDRVLPIEEAAQAHRVLEESSHVGKVILRVA